MPEPHIVERILTDIEFITDHWTHLLEARQPGTPRPWRQALLDPERRSALADRDRDERTNRDPDAPGFTSAPEHIDVLDVLVDTWTTLDELTAAISPDWRRTHTGGALPRAAAEHGPTPITHIGAMADFIRDWLPHADPDPDKLARITRQLAALTTEITRVLGLIRAGQLLTGATCPWCRGVTPHHPAGGATTLRVEEIPARPANQYRPAVEAVPVVVCWNPLCEPSDGDCGTRWRSRPAWPWHEWDWLAKRLIIADPPATLPANTTFWDDPATFAIIHSGRSGVDQAVAIVPPAGRTTNVTAEQPGEPVRFLGGPFDGRTRRFIRIANQLAVERPHRGRAKLTTHDTATDPIGTYVYAIVSDQPTYVWITPAGRATA